MNEEKIIVETSTKTASFGKKPRIEEGVYKGLLTEIKTRKDKDGNPVIGKWGNKQAILVFLVIDKATSTPVTYKTEDGEEKPVELAQVLSTSYKGDNGDRTAFTPNSLSTKVFKALGWKGPQEGEQLVLNDYLNKEVKLFVEDYDVKIEDGEGYKASRINKISPLEG